MVGGLRNKYTRQKAYIPILYVLFVYSDHSLLYADVKPLVPVRAVPSCNRLRESRISVAQHRLQRLRPSRLSEKESGGAIGGPIRGGL